MGRRRSQVGSESRLLQHAPLAVVTRAFGYTGRKVAHRLLGEGIVVRTLTRNPGREYPFGGRMRAALLDFSDPDELRCFLRCFMEGAVVPYNTYWVRFGRGRATFDQAVQNARILFEAAARADVGRMVRFSVANASPESRLTYFRGKGLVEEFYRIPGYPTTSSVQPWYSAKATCRSTTWTGAAAFPGFPVFGNDDYKVQPIYAEDLAAQAVAAGCLSENFVADAAGPETLTFEKLLRPLASAMGTRIRLVHPWASP